MPKLFSTRELFYRHKWLGDLRMNFFVWWSNHGTTFVERSFRRIRVLNPESRRLVMEKTEPVIYAVYHGNMASLLSLEPRKRVTILISNSRDGEMIAQAAIGMGFSIARGSSARGAVKGTLELLQAAKEGNDLVFMVDGPKGPAHEVKPGVIRVAALSGLPIVPMGYAVRSAWVMRSWDRYKASSYATPEVTLFGEPLRVPADISDADCERLRQELNERMLQIQSSAEQLVAVAKN